MTDAPVRLPISRILSPESVAVIGASESIEKFGGRLLHCLVRQGFAGRIFPIHPARETLLGLPSYPNIAAAPAPVDVAVIAVPAPHLLATVRECASAGVGACVIITAQAAEFDAAGERLQAEIVAVAHAAGMRLLGPNCLGMINVTHGMALTSSSTMLHVPALRPGGVGLVSQSGALMATLFIIGDDHGVRFSRMVSVGNQADLELCDFFECLVEDAATRVICLYVEGLKSPRRFLALAQRAAALGKPVLAVKAGRTVAGQIAARSHTASLAGSFEAFEAASQASGVIVMDEPEGMVLAAGVLDKLGDIGPGSVAMVVSSGGCGAVTSDRLGAAGVPMVRSYSEDAQARLLELYLPRHINNPIDLGALKAGATLERAVATIDALLRDRSVAVVMFVMTPQPFMTEMAAALPELAQRANKPLFVVSNSGSLGDGVRRLFIESGTPMVSRVDDSLRVLELLFRRRELSARPSDEVERPRGIALPLLPSAGALVEPEVKSLLRHYGIGVTEDRAVASADEAVAAARSLGFPVVMKGIRRGVVHKTEAGLVKLRLADDVAVRQAYLELQDALAHSSTDAESRVFVQPMVVGETELIIGARYDQDFGPQLLVGIGGVYVEVLREVRTALAPVSASRARELLAQLRLWPLLQGARGRPPADVDAAADAIARVSWLAADLGPRLIELDVNPLVVRAAGEGVVAVDGRASLA